MNLYDNENEILYLFQSPYNGKPFYLNSSVSTHRIYKCISKEKCWNKWANSSGKGDPPPDFYSDKYKMMMEVMRVDDHTHKNSKGKLINPVNIKESQLQSEIRKFANVDENTRIMINAVKGLPSREDHNYDYSLQSFSRVVNKHKESVELYRANHKGYKLVFFIFDESSAYVKVESKELAQKGAKHGEAFMGVPHHFFLDKSFIDIIKECGADYVVWYTPFKNIDSHGMYPQLPKIVVIDVNKLDKIDCLKTYDTDYIMSIEE